MMTPEEILKNPDDYRREVHSQPSMYADGSIDHAALEAEANGRIEKLRRAEALLLQAQKGDLLWMEGSCPSGPTFDQQWRFDASESQRSEILETAWRLSYRDAWYSTLNRAAEGTAAESQTRRMDYRAACTTHPV